MAKKVKAPPLNVENDVFGFIVEFSQKHLYFPMTTDISAKFGFSRTYPYEVIEKLVQQGKIEKIGRYNFRIAPDHLPS